MLAGLQQVGSDKCVGPVELLLASRAGGAGAGSRIRGGRRLVQAVVLAAGKGDDQERATERDERLTALADRLDAASRYAVARSARPNEVAVDLRLEAITTVGDEPVRILNSVYGVGSCRATDGEVVLGPSVNIIKRILVISENPVKLGHGKV